MKNKAMFHSSIVRYTALQGLKRSSGLHLGVKQELAAAAWKSSDVILSKHKKRVDSTTPVNTSITN